MQENSSLENIKKYIENIKNEILEKQSELNELIGILNSENDFESND